MHVLIAKVDQVFYDGEAESLSVPGSGGEMTILGSHMPLVTTLKEGTIIVRPHMGPEQSFPVESGLLEVRHEGATILL